MKTATGFTIYDQKLYCAQQFIKHASAAWMTVFPKSSLDVNGDIYGNFVLFHGYLTGSPSELSNGILLRDPLAYVGVYRGEELGFFEELVGVHVKSPKDALTVYHLSFLAPISIYQPTYQKMLDRFYEVRRLVWNNRDGLLELGFNVNDKLEVQNDHL
jgi:hypothetical protein